MTPTLWPGLEAVAESGELAQLDARLAGQPDAVVALADALDGLPRGRWDWCIMDCPTALGLASLSALVAADGALVPVEASVMALAGLADLAATVDRLRARVAPDLELAGILPVRVDPRLILAREVLRGLREMWGAVVFESYVRETVRLREAAAVREPITVYEPDGQAAADYRAVAQELRERLT